MTNPRRLTAAKIEAARAVALARLRGEPAPAPSLADHGNGRRSPWSKGRAGLSSPLDNPSECPHGPGSRCWRSGCRG